MPHLSGVFDEFPDLDSASVEEILDSLKNKPEIHALVNFFGNRIVYPQAIPLTLEELEIDLAILKQAFKQKPGIVYEPQASRLVIPERYMVRFPQAELLAQAIIEGVNPKGEHQIYLKSTATGGRVRMELMGTVVSPLNPQELSQDDRTVLATINGVQKQLFMGQINVIKTTGMNLKMTLANSEYIVSGGEAGIFVDLRKGSF